MRRHRSGQLLVIVAMALLSGCAGENSNGTIARPVLVDYPPAFQARAAEELEALGLGCALHAPGEGCSTVATMIEDYGELRARISGR